MASETITIRFPSGAWEYAVTERVPEVGDTLVREGETWNVALVAESVDDHRVVIMALRARPPGGRVRARLIVVRPTSGIQPG